MLKFLVAVRTVTLECTMVLGPGVPQLVISQVTKEKIQVAIHPEYPEQTIAIGSTLTEEGRKELCGLLRRNLDMTKLMCLHIIKKLLAEAVKEKEELKTKLESFETSSKSINTLLNSQLSANDKAGFGHNGAKESKVSETITSVSKVETSNSETSNKVEMPKIKTVRMSEPIIEEWESDSEDDEIVVKPKEVTKTVKPSFEKIESVNARNETVRQAENPRKNNKSPRGNKRNWNGMMTQKLVLQLYVYDVPGQFSKYASLIFEEFEDLSTTAERFFEDASKQGRIHDAYATVTKEQKVDDDKISNNN
ncbi:hypothetical protein Tco_0768139 [Tanacetum coccineum]